MNNHGRKAVVVHWCIYCTKLEPIFKTNDSEQAPRTGEYASNPERKNTPCTSDLAGVKFLLEKERVFFFRGSALQVFGQVECRMQFGRGKAKTIFAGGKGFCFAQTNFFKTARFGFPPRRRVREECAADSLLVSLDLSVRLASPLIRVVYIPQKILHISKSVL